MVHWCIFDSLGGSSGGSELVQKWVDSIDTDESGSVGHVLSLLTSLRLLLTSVVHYYLLTLLLYSFLYIIRP